MGITNVEHRTFLKKFLTIEGKFDYNLLNANEVWLEEQIQEIKTTKIETLSKSDTFAFYLNAYNILTLKSVLIELNKNPNWEGNTGWVSRLRFFLLRKFSIGGKKMSLYTLENKILRKKFKDPRIHFALNCASNSCPALLGNLFIGESLDETLTLLTESFVNNPNNVSIDEERRIIFLNQIFKWYKKDFRPDGVINFIAKYKNIQVNRLMNFQVKYLKYDWTLNKQ